MNVCVVLNDTSLCAGLDPTQDEALVEMLAKSFLSLQRAVAAYDERRVRAYVPITLHSLKLPSGTLLTSALNALMRRSPDLGRRLRSIILNEASHFDEDGGVSSAQSRRTDEVTYNGGSVPALRAAWALRGLCWSADRPDWRNALVLIQVSDTASVWRNEQLANVWSSMLDSLHRAALGAHVTVLPVYEDPHHHDPDWPAFYDRSKSQIPRSAERILRHAVAEEDGSTWWARCEHKFYHRFQGSIRNGWLVVHWNGTTNENATGNCKGGKNRTTERDVPAIVRDRLELLERVSDCGCREV